MSKLNGPRDERGTSMVVGGILLIAIVTTAFAFYYPRYIQSSIHSSEAGLMNDVRSRFLQLKSQSESTGAGDSWGVSTPMNANYPPLVPYQGDAGVIASKPGLARLRGAASFNVGKGTSLGDLDALKGNDENYLEINQVIFSDKFPDNSLWTENTLADDPATPTPNLDAFASYPDDGTSSISVSCKATKYDRPKQETATWTRDLDNLLDNFHIVTLTGWLMQQYVYYQPQSPNVNMSWRLDIKDNKGNWNNGVVSGSYVSSEPSSSPWTRQNENKPPFANGFDNGVRAIRAYLSAYEDCSPAAISDSNAFLWWDDISLHDGPPFNVDLTITSEPVLFPENLDNIIVILDFSSKDSSSRENLYIRNYSDNTWKLLRSDILGENDVTWENRVKKDNYVNPVDDTISIRIIGENKTSPFTLALDYLEFGLEYLSFKPFLWGIYGISGRITFGINNNYYPSQNYFFEDGALVLVQGKSNVMVSDPELVVVKPSALGDNIEVWVHHFVITGPAASVAKRGWSTVRVSVMGTYYVFLPTGRNRENVVISIDNISPYTNAWASYFSRCVENFNKVQDNVASFKDNTFTIWGKLHENKHDNDIFYYETFTEIRVELT